MQYLHFDSRQWDNDPLTSLKFKSDPFKPTMVKIIPFLELVKSWPYNMFHEIFGLGKQKNYCPSSGHANGNSVHGVTQG